MEPRQDWASQLRKISVESTDSADSGISTDSGESVLEARVGLVNSIILHPLSFGPSQVVEGREDSAVPPPATLALSRADLVELVANLEVVVAGQARRLHDLEDYLDLLLTRVMDSAPQILEKPGCCEPEEE